MSEKKAKHVNPWLHLWVEPRNTIEQILVENPTKLIVWFAVIMGALDAFIGLSLWEQRGSESVWMILAIFAAGIIFGLLQLFVGGWLLQLTGSWLGGKGNYTDVKCAVGWAMYPTIVTHLIFIADLFIGGHPAIDISLGLLHILLSVWALVILFMVVGQAHRFSTWKGLAAVLLAFLIVIVVIMLVSLLIPLISPLFLN